MGKHADAIAVGDIDVGPSRDEQAYDLGMIRTPIAEDDRLHERAQTQVVDVVLVDCGREQKLHRLDVAAVAGRDQGGAAEAIEALEVGLRPQHQLEDFGTTLCAGDEKRAAGPVQHRDVNLFAAIVSSGACTPAGRKVADGAEPLLQLAADYLSETRPLDAFWQHRVAQLTGQRRYR